MIKMLYKYKDMAPLGPLLGSEMVILFSHKWLPWLLPGCAHPHHLLVNRLVLIQHSKHFMQHASFTQALFSVLKCFLSNIHKTSGQYLAKDIWHADLSSHGIKPQTFGLVHDMLDLLSYSQSPMEWSLACRHNKTAESWTDEVALLCFPILLARACLVSTIYNSQ